MCLEMPPYTSPHIRVCVGGWSWVDMLFWEVVDLSRSVMELDEEVTRGRSRNVINLPLVSVYIFPVMIDYTPYTEPW